MNVIFTICSNNYLSQALSLRKSLFDSQSDVSFYIFLADKKNDFFEDSSIIDVQQLGITNSIFETLLNEYNVIEFNTALKPYVFEYLIQHINASKIIYLDPDILVWNSLESIWNELDVSDFVLTPHIVKPIVDNTLYHLLLGAINTGAYNLGFLALRTNDITLSFIKWWKQHMVHFGHNDILKGQFYDQKVFNLLPSFYGKVHISQHYGRNVAEWNLHERVLSMQGNIILSNHQILEFFHYSGVKMTSYQDNIEKNDLLKRADSPVLKLLIERYIQNNIYFGYHERKKERCFYDLKPNIHRASRKEIYLYKLKKWLQFKK